MTDRSAAYLRARLELLADRVEDAVTRRRADDVDPNDRFRGLYLSDADVDDLLGRRREARIAPTQNRRSDTIEVDADAWEASGENLSLRRLQRAFGLDLVDVDLLLVALAPDLDPSFERLYGYLHDDVTRRRASVGLALELCDIAQASAEGRRRLAPSAALVAGGLIVVEEHDRPVLTRPLRVPDRVSAQLLGDESFDPEILALLIDLPSVDGPSWPTLENALRRAVSPIYLRETLGTSAAWSAASTVERIRRRAIILDAVLLASTGDPVALSNVIAREAQLRDAVLIVVDIDALVEKSVRAVERLADSDVQVIIGGARAWDPGWSRSVPLVLDVPTPSRAERITQLTAALNGHGSDPLLNDATLAFRMNPLQILRTAQATEVIARARGRAVEASDVQAAARAQNGSALERLARRVEPKAAWADLVLPDQVAVQLHELASRARQRDRVYDEWGVGRRGSRGHGVTALFAGDSGTGKTLASEVIAGELGLDLYVIDLSTVVDKYIGETEKNLDRIFAEADRINGVLLFDEADAIFGKRSEVRDARDRYANVEIAYLLQRMERFDGLAVLTTNLRANLDEAFTRRLDVIVDFPMPEEDDRHALWTMHLSPGLPKAEDLDLDFMAHRFRFSGGNIRNVCVSAAFFAADSARPVSMSDLIRGTEREYRKMGRLTVEEEFGPYFGLMAEARQA